MLHQFVYASSAITLMSKQELASLLHKSRENNTRDEITGMLLYHEGTFIQAIEGEREKVERLRQRIELDPCHRGIISLYNAALEERQFGGWAMGFRSGDAVIKEAKGFEDLLGIQASMERLKAQPGRARQLLLSFSESWARR